MTRIARHLVITGHVQGVFFRAWTVETARSLGLAGWVRNRRDGSVEAFAQGEESAIARFLDQVRNGPPAARVDDIRQSDAEPEALTTFDKRPTL